MTKKDLSYGIIPLRQHKEKWEVLLIRHVKSHWAFPKGHADPGETPIQTATRELKEETGLNIVSVISEKPFEEHYFFTWDHVRIEKTVIYFPAIVEGVLQLELEEVDDAKWLSFPDAEKRATFSETKNICRKLLTIKF